MEKVSFKYPLLLAGFGIICLIAAMIMSMDVGEPQITSLTKEGGKFGPIVTRDHNEVVKIELRQRLPLMKWSAVDVEVMDENGNYLFAFGDEFWHETGRDSEGRWEEAKHKYSLAVTFPQPGSYFLNISAEGNATNSNPHISVRVRHELGSSLIFIWLGMGALFLAGLLFYLKVNDK